MNKDDQDVPLASGLPDPIGAAEDAYKLWLALDAALADDIANGTTRSHDDVDVKKLLDLHKHLSTTFGRRHMNHFDLETKINSTYRFMWPDRLCSIYCPELPSFGDLLLSIVIDIRNSEDDVPELILDAIDTLGTRSVARDDQHRRHILNMFVMTLCWIKDHYHDTHFAQREGWDLLVAAPWSCR
jgi:hypothetical protein